jgi:hypothetical protein
VPGFKSFTTSVVGAGVVGTVTVGFVGAGEHAAVVVGVAFVALVGDEVGLLELPQPASTGTRTARAMTREC